MGFLILDTGQPVDRRWETVAAAEAPSWYLDPLVARQKQRLNAALVLSSLPHPVGRALKTDSFEEAYGEDSPLPHLLHLASQWYAIDGTERIVANAHARMPSVKFLAADIRAMPLGDATLDLVFSNSTLDHFRTRQEFETAFQELTRLVRPGGLLVITLDNPLNPLYWPLRWLSGTRWAPFPLGYTVRPGRLAQLLRQQGFEVQSSGVLIHNPRLVSTFLFMGLRRLLPAGLANAAIGALLKAFQLLDHLPTRWLTGCFLTATAIRRT